MSTLVTRSESALSASSEAPRPEALLPDPALRNILQRACPNIDKADLANLLLSSKRLRSEVLASCQGLIPLEYTTAKTATEAEAFAQWLGKHGQLASSLRFYTAVKWHSADAEDAVIFNRDFLAQLVVEAEHQRALIEGAVAAGLQLAANNNSESAGTGLYLQACCLYDAGPNVAAVLQQLPASCLTSLQLQISQPTGSDDTPGTYLRPLLISCMHLTNLNALKVSFEHNDPMYLVCIDPMMEQMSSLTNLTSLSVSMIEDGAVLWHLPASLQRLQLQWTNLLDTPVPSLGHLTALTNLEFVDYFEIRSGDDFPPNLLTLEVTDLQDVEPLLLLTKLQALTLGDGYYAAEANLQKLSDLAALSYVKVNGDTRWNDPERIQALKQALEGLPNLKRIICEW